MNSTYQPISKRSGSAGDMTLTTFNLYNLFPAEQEALVRIWGEWQRPFRQAQDRPFLPIQLAKLSLAIQYELTLPAIIAVQEVGSEAVLQQLADQVNRAAGTDYHAISPPTSDRRGLQIGFLYDRQRVDLLLAEQLSGVDVAAAFGPHSANPGREPLTAVFRIAHQEITIINNHFKSNYIPDEQAAKTRQVLQANLKQRTAQAQAVRRYVNEILAANPAALLAVVGDLNTSRRDGTQEDLMAPIRILEGRPPETRLTNLLPRKQNIHEYTFIWEGENEILDHILVSPALLERLAGVDVLHFNAAYPEALRLARSLANLVSGNGEVLGLAALLEFQISRLAARVDSDGSPILLQQQD
ncbi:MAG: DUF6596 domain-containing protein, partial [Chloroflexota bacterium]